MVAIYSLMSRPISRPSQRSHVEIVATSNDLPTLAGKGVEGASSGEFMRYAYKGLR